MFGMRGFEISHETVRAWEEQFSSHFADELRAKRKGTVGRVLYIDETYMKLRGKHCYFYRGMDENGNIVDVFLSKKRDMRAAKAFLSRVSEIGESTPARVISDGLTSYPKAIKEVFGKDVKHTVVPCTANKIEQDRRSIKARYYRTLLSNGRLF